MKFNLFVKAFLFGVVSLLVVSCDKDINQIGADLLGSNHFDLGDATAEGVLAYNMKLGPVQTSNLPINQLGVYNNPTFGKTTANFVTQLELATVNPTIVDASNVEVDSVYLHVPYYSTLLSTDSNNDSTYELDSIYGKTGSDFNKIKLEVYRSGYFLNSLDPSTGLLSVQNYYSDNTDIENNIFPTRLNNSTDVSQNDQFEFKSNQIKLYKGNNSNVPTTTVSERLAPGIYMDLDKDAFKTAIINAPSGKLLNNNIFKDYFRGIFFKASSIGSSNGALAMLNFAQGKIVIAYRDKTSSTVATVIKKKITLNMKGNTVNLLNNDYVNPDTTPNSFSNDDKFYLQGGSGSMAVLELFDATKLAELRTEADNHKLLVNDATITFTIDQGALGSTAPEPNRLYLYDLTNNRPLIDYYYDVSTRPSTKYNKYSHGGILLNNTDGVVAWQSTSRGTKYKLRLTNHIRNVIINDSTNVKLGLVVSEGITNTGNGYLKTPLNYTTDGKKIKYTPLMNIANPFGTILYGNTVSVPEEKKLKFEVYYTKPD